MSILSFLIPLAISLGAFGLIAFLWALKSGQFEDLDGAGYRILLDDDEEFETRSSIEKMKIENQERATKRLEEDVTQTKTTEVSRKEKASKC